MDTELQDCDGDEALRTIARAHAGPTLIALTLEPKLNGFPRDRSLSPFAYLTKPFEAEQVRFVVERAVERAALHRRVKYLDRQIRLRERPAAPSVAAAPGSPRELGLFRRCAKLFAREVRVPELAAGLAEVLAEELVVGSVAVLLWDEAARRFAPAAAYGLDEQAIAETAFVRGAGVPGWLDEHGVVLRRDEAARTLEAEQGMTLAREFELLRAELAVPLLHRGALVGFISVGRKASGLAISEAEIEQLAVTAGMAAVAVENARARHALAYEKRCLERVLEGLDVGVVAADAKGTITACNRAAAQALGLEPPPLGENVRALGSALSELADQGVRSGARASARQVRHETSGRRVLVNAAPIAGPDGPAGVVLVLREDALHAAERTRAERADERDFWSELAGRMAHTLKNPLVSIKTFTQLLPERYDDDEFRKSFLGVVAAEADKINEVADRLLLYSAAHEIEPVPTDLRALVETVLAAAAPRCRRLGVQVERDLEEPPVTMADPQRLTVALTNVVDNALDAMEEGGRLGVSTHLVEAPVTVSAGDRLVMDFAGGGQTGAGPSAFVAVEISDTGCGIAPERLSKVIEPFRSDKVHGVGLGLAIVAKVIEEHGGRVEIASTPGRGTRVRLLVPTAC